MLFGYFRDEYMICWLAQYSSLAGAASPQFCAEAAVWYCWLSGSLSTPLCVCVCVCGPYSRRWIQPFYLSLCLVSSPRKGPSRVTCIPKNGPRRPFWGPTRGSEAQQSNDCCLSVR